MDSEAETVIFFLLGLGALGFGIWQLRREISPRRWLHVPGTIVASRIHEQPRGRAGYQYLTVIEYEYHFNGRTFNSSRRCQGNYASGRRAEAESIHARYPGKAAITVLVNPKRPNISVLEYGATPLSWICICLGMALVALAALMAK